MPTSALNWVWSGVAVPWMTGAMMSVTTERGSRTPEQADTTGGFDCAWALPAPNAMQEAENSKRQATRTFFRRP
jgi:hypothetical protein